MRRFRDHNDRIGNVEPAGAPLVEYVPPPPLVQYEARIVATYPWQPYSAEQILAAHRANLFKPKRSIALAKFRSHSLSRRFA